MQFCGEVKPSEGESYSMRECERELSSAGIAVQMEQDKPQENMVYDDEMLTTIIPDRRSGRQKCVNRC